MVKKRPSLVSVSLQTWMVEDRPLQRRKQRWKTQRKPYPSLCGRGGWSILIVLGWLGLHTRQLSPCVQVPLKGLIHGVGKESLTDCWASDSDLRCPGHGRVDQLFSCKYCGEVMGVCSSSQHMMCGLGEGLWLPSLRVFFWKYRGIMDAEVDTMSHHSQYKDRESCVLVES